MTINPSGGFETCTWGGGCSLGGPQTFTMKPSFSTTLGILNTNLTLGLWQRQRLRDIMNSLADKRNIDTHHYDTRAGPRAICRLRSFVRPGSFLRAFRPTSLPSLFRMKTQIVF